MNKINRKLLKIDLPNDELVIELRVFNISGYNPISYKTKLSNAILELEISNHSNKILIIKAPQLVINSKTLFKEKQQIYISQKLAKEFPRKTLAKEKLSIWFRGESINRLLKLTKKEQLFFQIPSSNSKKLYQTKEISGEFLESLINERFKAESWDSKDIFEFDTKIL